VLLCLRNPLERYCSCRATHAQPVLQEQLTGPRSATAASSRVPAPCSACRALSISSLALDSIARSPSTLIGDSSAILSSFVTGLTLRLCALASTFNDKTLEVPPHKEG
jgi:hypothetical protein